jgi:hypothetical protein
MTAKILLGIYIIFCFGMAVFAALCTFTYCQLLGFLPASPWVQLFGTFLNIDLPFWIIGIFYLLNGAIFFFIGKGIDALIGKHRG